MQAQTVLLGGGWGYPQSSVVNYGDGLYYAVQDAYGNPDQYPDSWALLATRSSGGADSDIYRADGIQAGGTGGSRGQYGIENRSYTDLVHSGIYLDADAISHIVQDDADNGPFSENTQSTMDWGFYVPDDGTGTAHTLLEMGVDRNTRVPYVRILGSEVGTGSSDLPASATTGQVLTWNGTSWDAETLPTSATGGATQLAQLDDVDESTPPATGQVLTWNGTKWAPATPAPSSGGGGGGGALQVGTSSTAIPTDSTDGWIQNASYGTLTSDGTELELTSNTASQFVRYYQDTVRPPAPVWLGPVVLEFDIMIDSANALGGSAGMVLTSAGEYGGFAVRLDVDNSGNVGMRFEQDQMANLQAVMPVPGLSLDTWHTIRFVKDGASGVAYADGVKVLGVDNGPAQNYTAATVLMFGANQAGMVAHYRNISVTTVADLESASTGGATLPDPGADGNLLTAQSSAWVSAPLPADDMPSLVLLFENQLI